MFGRLPGALRAGLAAPCSPGTPLETGTPLEHGVPQPSRGASKEAPPAQQQEGAGDAGPPHPGLATTHTATHATTLQHEGVRLQLHEGGAAPPEGPLPRQEAPRAGPPAGPEEGSWDDARALENFGLLMLEVEHVDRVVLGSWPHQRWQYWTTSAAAGGDGGIGGGGDVVEGVVDGVVWHTQQVQV